MYVKSQQYTFTPGAPVPILLENFLRPYMSRMAAPVVRKMSVLVDFSVVVGSAKTPRQRLSEMFDRIQLADGAGDRVNARGSSIYIANQQELGIGYADGADLAVSGTDTGVFELGLPFRPRNTDHRDAYGIPLGELLGGGQLVIYCTGSTTLGGTNEISSLTASSNFITIVADVVDEGVPTSKSRMCLFDYPILKADDTYPLNGLCRWAVAYAGQVAHHSGTTWPAQNITSFTKGLEWNLWKDTYLRALYTRSLNQRVGDGAGLAFTTPTRTEDVVTALYGIPLVFGGISQSIDEMIEDQVLHYKTDGSLTASDLPTMIMSTIQKTNADLAAKTLTHDGSTATLQAALASHGRVSTDKGVSSRPLAQTRRGQFKPIRLAGPAKK